MTRTVRRMVAMAALGTAALTGCTSAPASDASPVAGRSDSAPDVAVPTPEAPDALPVEPGPEEEVGTDPAPATAGGNGVAVVVTFAGLQAGQVEVAGYVAGVVEPGGTCTVELSGPGGAEATTSTEALPDATTTSCGWLSVPSDGMAAGAWTATLRYDSAAHHATAEPVTLEVA